MLEGATRRASMCQAYYRTFPIRERYIVSVSSNFLTQISCGIRTKCCKTRAMQRDFTIVDSLALRAVRVKPISCALRACFLGHYRMARMSQSASSCGLASWMRTQECNTFMIPDTHSLKLLFLARYTSRSIYLPSYQSALFCGRASWIYIAAIYYCDAPASLLFYKNSKILIQWTNIRKN